MRPHRRRAVPPQPRPSATAIEAASDAAFSLPRGAVLAVAGWLAACAVGTLVARHNGGWQTFHTLVLGAFPDAAGVALALRAARRLRRTGHRRSGRVLAFVSCACALRLVADAVLVGYYYIGGRADPFPSLADPLRAAAAVALVFAAGTALESAGRRRRVGAGIDVAVAALGLDKPSLCRRRGEQRSPGPGTRLGRDGEPPILDLIALVILLSGGGRVRRSVSGAAGLVGASLVVQLATDLTAAAVTYSRADAAGSFLHLGEQLAGALLVLAAVSAGRDAVEAPETRSASMDLPDIVELSAVTVTVRQQGADLTPGAVTFVPLLAGMAAVLSTVVVEAVTGRVGRPSLVLSGAAVAAVLVRLLMSIADQRAIARALRTSLSEQQRLAITDVLTGLYDRRFIEETLSLETTRARRDGGQVAVVLFDLDHFKAVNDTYGHQAGDAVLVEAGRRIQQGVRTSDVVGRWGGEEFLLVLRGTDEVEALAVAQRARETLSASEIPLPDGRSIAVSASAGVACQPKHGCDADSLLWQADQALYAAKGAGRNRIVLAAELVASADTRRSPAEDGDPLAADVDAGVGERSS